MGSPAISPPPAAPASDDVTPQLGPASLGSGSRMDFVRSLINNLSGGGIPVIQERLAADFAKRQQDAENFRNQARQGTTYSTHARATVDNSIDPATGKPRAPFGINAMTGQPATAEDIQGWHNDISTGREGYLKTLPKDAKPVAQKLFDVVHHITGHKGGTGAAPLLEPGDFGGETAAPNSPAIPAPPQAAAGSPGPAIPPPPGQALPPSMQDAALALPEQQRMTGVQNAIQAESAKTQAELSGQIKAREELLKRDPTLADDPMRMSMMLGHPLYGVMSKTVGSGGGFAKDLRNQGYDVPSDAPDDQWLNVKKLGGGQTTFVPGAPPSGQYTMTPGGPETKYQAGIEKEKRQFGYHMALQQQGLQNALTRNDYDGARKIVNDGKVNYFTSVRRAQIMDQSLADIEKAQAQGRTDQQAMVNLLSNHVLMTTGAGEKGATRATRALFDEAAKSAPWMERIEAHFDKNGYLSGVVLTPDQMQNMVALGHERVGVMKDNVDNLNQAFTQDLMAKHGRGIPPPPGGKAAPSTSAAPAKQWNAKTGRYE